MVYLFKNRNIPIEVGDLNCDNSVDIADVTYIFKNYDTFRNPVVFAKNFQLDPHWDEGYCYAKDASGKWYVIVKEGYSKPSYIPPNAEIVYTGQSTKTNQRQFGETTFLGMVEWVKFYSAFNGEDEYNKADAFFQNTWKKKNSLLRITRNAKNEPKIVVFCWYKEKNKPFVFEAQNFRANWVNDVRGDYVFNNMPGTAGEYMDTEDFYEKVMGADVCILLDYTGDAKTKDDLLKLNPKFANFKAFRNGRFYVSKENILLANMYDAGNVMEDYARMVHPELFSGGDGELKHFVNIKYGSNSYDANYLTSNDLLSDFDFVVKLAIGEDLYKFACGEECNKVGLAIDIATLPVFEGKAIVIGGKLCAKKLIPVIIKFVVKDTGKDVIFKVGNIVLKEEWWGHILNRHVYGTELNKDAATFFPMGQTVNGKKLPKIIDDTDELKKIIKEAIEKNEKKFYEDENGNPKIKYMYEKGGKVIEITLHFQKMKNGVYELRTIYPEKGDGVYKYVKNVGWFKSVYDKNTGKWKFVPEN
ncbi:ABC transporter substrate-binding protein [Methanothermococcus sp. Ax23]|uniref:ABC transporter substrate-binding protein n=1 Tax=Methanothermococcus sp. Ax23 TaxID=3156486 RepID=UPI003BA36952